MPGIIINKLTEDEAKKDIEGAIDRAMEVLASLLDAAGSVFAQLQAPAKDVYNCAVGNMETVHRAPSPPRAVVRKYICSNDIECNQTNYEFTCGSQARSLLPRLYTSGVAINDSVLVPSRRR